jgi:hypothetical protein
MSQGPPAAPESIPLDPELPELLLEPVLLPALELPPAPALLLDVELLPEIEPELPKEPELLLEAEPSEPTELPDVPPLWEDAPPLASVPASVEELPNWSEQEPHARKMVVATTGEKARMCMRSPTSREPVQPLTPRLARRAWGF